MREMCQTKHTASLAVYGRHERFFVSELHSKPMVLGYTMASDRRSALYKRGEMRLPSLHNPTNLHKSLAR